MKILIRKEAEQDIYSARAWYQQQSPLAARQLLETLNHTLVRIADFPNAFPQVEGHTRRAILGRFPYTIYFREKDGLMEVHAAFHQRRKPQSRLIR